MKNIPPYFKELVEDAKPYGLDWTYSNSTLVLQLKEQEVIIIDVEIVHSGGLYDASLTEDGDEKYSLRRQSLKEIRFHVSDEILKYKL